MLVKHVNFSFISYLLLIAVTIFLDTEFVSADTISSDSLIVQKVRARGISFSNNNSVVLLSSGAAKFKDLFKAIKYAKKSIHMEYFNFRNDSIANLLFDKLILKRKEGIEVKLLFDGFGNDSNDKPLQHKHLKRLRDAGIEIFEFDPLLFPYFNHALHRDHRKIVVIDGIIAYTGGMNIADYYINGTPLLGDWRDMHARISGDIVDGFQAIFIRMWNKVSGENVHGTQYFSGEKDAQVLFPQLDHDKDSTAKNKMIALINREPHISANIIRRTFIDCINSAQDHIEIINPYLTLNKKIKKALKSAINRGVKVNIMVSKNSDIPITPRIVEYNVYQLYKEGAHIYYYLGGFHHSKVMMVDDKFSFLGSANLDSRSLFFDYECNILVIDKSITKKLDDIFYNDVKNRCIKLSKDLWKEKNIFKRTEIWLLHFLIPFV